MEFLFTSESLISFLVLVVLEIVLGIDNVIFVSIIMNRLPKEKQKRARLIFETAWEMATREDMLKRDMPLNMPANR